jgi:hypothetical protein
MIIPIASVIVLYFIVDKIKINLFSDLSQQMILRNLLITVDLMRKQLRLKSGFLTHHGNISSPVLPCLYPLCIILAITIWATARQDLTLAPFRANRHKTRRPSQKLSTNPPHR